MTTIHITSTKVGCKFYQPCLGKLSLAVFTGVELVRNELSHVCVRCHLKEKLMNWHSDELTSWEVHDMFTQWWSSLFHCQDEPSFQRWKINILGAIGRIRTFLLGETNLSLLPKPLEKKQLWSNTKNTRIQDHKKVLDFLECHCIAAPLQFDTGNQLAMSRNLFYMSSCDGWNDWQQSKHQEQSRSSLSMLIYWQVDFFLPPLCH